MEPPVRLRLHFHGVLTKSQKSDGLKRCWILLRPDLATVSDLSCHIARSFEIASSSSDGLVLSMDGFVLPSFESTCIFKDKDAVRVNKKGNLHKQAIKIGADSNYMEESEHVKRLAPSSSNLLAIEEFEKEAGGYQSEHEENESGSPGNAEQLENLPSENTILKKKRKHSDKHQSSKRKKTKLSGPAECVMISNNSTEDAHVEENGCCVQKEALLQKSVPIENLPLDTERKSDLIISSEKDNSDTNVLRSAALHKRHNQECENGQVKIAIPDVLAGEKKCPSRSARRKKAKRRWLRELANAEKKESLQVALPGKVEKQKHLSAGQEKSNKQQVEKHLSAGLENSNKHTDGEDETVPIVVRPGHIRFEPLGKEQCQQKLQEPTNTIEWNGTTSKKTGKKWGMEKNFKWTGSGKHDSDGGCNAEVVPEVGGMLAQDPVDYEKLMPLSGFPEEGDVIAYRLVELSSSWCPELSSFRVGKVSFFDAVSQKITLVTVPGYPVSPEEKNDGEEMTQFQSMYNEDGSLEADLHHLLMFVSWRDQIK
ncbi:hypothetical protein QJS10_CPA06g01237 [Acorus calamus]|uniref:Coilin n=1 Tax=Acorus calamus TaxID=4465 RepID=A0AAV9ENA2_ACOCL|nr:hypothetical protein QJS10_CPA06g01237 [Acorus calamus]